MDSRCLLSYVVSISILFLFTQLFLWVLMGIFTQGWCPDYPFLHPTFLLVFNGRFHPRVAPELLFFSSKFFYEFWQAPWLSFCSSNFFIYYDRRFHPRVAPGLLFCSSNFFLCFDGRFYLRVTPGFLHPTFLWDLTGVFTQGWRPGKRFAHPTYVKWAIINDPQTKSLLYVMEGLTDPSLESVI